MADEFERTHPDTQIEILDVPISERGWLVTQLAAGTAPDIISVNVEDVWQDVQKGWYAALDPWLEAPNRFVKSGDPGSRQWWDLFKYQAISRGKAAPDGKMYCVTLDMVETGIYYNVDLFNRLGLKPPKDWADFMRIQQRIQDAGVLPMLVAPDQLADWGVDVTFDGLYRDIRPGIDLVSDPKRAAYMKGYLDWDEICLLNRKGFFGPHDLRWREVFRILKEWRRYMPQDLGATDRMREFVQGKGAMLWSASWEVPRLMKDPDLKFKWDVFYLPPITKATSRFGGGYPACVIGGAATQLSVTNTGFADTGNPATSERMKRCAEFLEFLTTPKNCARVVNEITCFLPNVVGAEPNRGLERFAEILQRDYTTTKWIYTFDLRFAEITNRMLELYLMGGTSEDEFMDWMDRNVATAAATIVRRKNLDLAPLEKRWEALAPVRKGMAELPPEAQTP